MLLFLSKRPPLQLSHMLHPAVRPEMGYSPGCMTECMGCSVTSVLTMVLVLPHRHLHHSDQHLLAIIITVTIVICRLFCKITLVLSLPQGCEKRAQSAHQRGSFLEGDLKHLNKEEPRQCQSHTPHIISNANPKKNINKHVPQHTTAQTSAASHRLFEYQCQGLP